MPEIDLGYGGNQPANSGGATEQKTDLGTGKEDTAGVGGGISTELVPAGGETPANGTGNGEGNQPANGTNGQNSTGEGNENNNNDLELTEGTNIAIGDDNYTVDKDGNLVDKDGKVFKEAKDVKEFIKSFDVVDNGEETQLTIDAIQEALGFEAIDEDGNPVTFDNTPDGVKAYIDSILEANKEEYARAGVNQLLEHYPIVQDVINYYVANGNSLEGFGEVKDRSTIVIDENNTAQQEAIIRESFKEFGRGEDVDDYIQYLKDKGMLYNASQKELQALVKADADYKAETAEAARQAYEQQQKDDAAYWEEVHNTIKSRKIAGYEIPDTIIINKDGKKIAATPNDFFNYIYQVDEKGNSRYSADLSKLTPEQKREDSLLRAYLRFTGGSYADLVKMAIKEEEVVKLRKRSTENAKRTVRITSPTAKPKGGVQSDFGYNKNQ